jgi:hypothetical protein
MLDSRLLSHLERHQIPFCLIGSLALTAWGVPRYTADADLLTLDRRVLELAFWNGCDLVFREDMNFQQYSETKS